MSQYKIKLNGELVLVAIPENLGLAFVYSKSIIYCLHGQAQEQEDSVDKLKKWLVTRDWKRSIAPAVLYLILVGLGLAITVLGQQYQKFTLFEKHLITGFGMIVVMIVPIFLVIFAFRIKKH